MKKKVLISYIWPDRSDERWLFWLKKKLEVKNFEVTFSQLPQELVATKNQAHLVKNLQEMHDISEQNTHFVAHDPGCLTILNYLEYLDKHNKLEPTLLIAGFPKDKNNSANSAVKRLEGSKAPVITNNSQELQLGTLDVKLVVIYSGLIGDAKLLELNDAKKKALPRKELDD